MVQWCLDIRVPLGTSFSKYEHQICQNFALKAEYCSFLRVSTNLTVSWGPGRAFKDALLIGKAFFSLSYFSSQCPGIFWLLSFNFLLIAFIFVCNITERKRMHVHHCMNSNFYVSQTKVTKF